MSELLESDQQLSQQLANVASGSDNSQIPHFLSREAVDAEKETSEKEVLRLKDVSKQKDTQLADKDKRIAELEVEGTLQPLTFSVPFHSPSVSQAIAF